MLDLAPNVPVLDLDPFSDAFLTDPFPGHHAMREAGPVVWLPRYGVYAMARHAEVIASLHDWEAFCSSRGVGLIDFAKTPPWRPASLLLEADPPTHDQARMVINPLLRPPTMNALRTQWRALADQMIDALAARGRFDAASDLAEVFPLKAFGDAVGLPEEGREHLLAYGDMVFNAYGPPNHLLQEATRRSQGALAWVAANCKRERLSPGGMGAAVFAAADRGEITEEEGERLVRSFLSAGFDTTVGGLSAVIYALATHPEAWRALKADRSLVRSAFEEALRWASAVQLFLRTTTREVEVAGVTIPEGSKVALFLAAANRDPRVWPQPDVFDIHRKPTGHVAFGSGIHACWGQLIARVESEAVLGALLDRVDTLVLDGEPKVRLNNSLRAFSSLPVRVS